MESAINTFTQWLLLFVFFVLLLKTYKKFRQGNFSVAFPAVAALFFFLGLPIIQDLLFGPGDFGNYRGFDLALNSIEASIYYNLYITYSCLVFLWYISKVKTKKFAFDTDKFYNALSKYKPILWLVLLSPILMVLISERPIEYLSYQAVLNNTDQAFRDSHVYVFRFALLGSVAGAFLFFMIGERKDLTIAFRYILLILLVFIAFWVDGKRGIFFKFFFVFIVAGLLLGKIQPKKILSYIIPGALVLVLIVLSYGKDFDASNNFSRDPYTSLRLNIGRDHTVKYTLYKEYVEDDMILEHRGQSFLFGLTFFVPRSRWEEKPYPYAVYFVTSVLNMPPEPIGWSFTTCILEEMISNFGFIGLILAPFFLLWICKVGDKSKSEFLTIISIVCVVFFLFTQMAAFLPIIILFIILLFKEKFSRFKIS